MILLKTFGIATIISIFTAGYIFGAGCDDYPYSHGDYDAVPTPNGGFRNFYDHTILSTLLQKINMYKVKNKHIVICCTVIPKYIDNIVVTTV